MGLFNWCPEDPAVFTGMHQWTRWEWIKGRNVRRCINCGFREAR